MTTQPIPTLLRHLFLLLCLLFSFAGSAQNDSGAPKRPTLLIFSGSDWCLPCIQLEKTILSDSLFLAYAAQNLLVVKADFPQRKKISQEQKRKNESLAEQYNPEGAFPKLLLLHSKQSEQAVLNWQGHSPGSFIEQVDAYLQVPENR